MTPLEASIAIPVLNSLAVTLGLPEVRVVGFVKNGEATLGVFAPEQPEPFISEDPGEIEEYLRDWSATLGLVIAPGGDDG